MDQSQLIELLGLSASSFRRWRSGLGITPKDSYPEDEQQQFLDLKDYLDQGIGFKEAVAKITGQAPQEDNPIAEALLKRAKSQLDVLNPEAIGKSLVPVFDQRVAISFIKEAKNSKPTAFEQMFGNSLLTLDPSDTIDALILEAAEDDPAA